MNEIDDVAFTAAFDELRQLIQADGGDMTVSSFDGGTVNIDLVLATANCVECVMPRPFLERVALDIFHNNGVAVAAVVLDDPREHPDFVAPQH